jgi:hypothetical protein
MLRRRAMALAGSDLASRGRIEKKRLVCVCDVEAQQ